MSTKIYTAYRLRKKTDLWPFVRDTRRKALKLLHAKLRSAFTQVVIEVSKSAEYQQKVLAGDQSESTLQFMAKRSLEHCYRDASLQIINSPFDFDIWITIREHRGRLYLIPGCGMGAHGCLDFLKRDKRLENFGYWNNTDKPKHITKKDWDTRRDIWHALDSGPTTKGQLHTGSWYDYLMLDICSYSGFYKIKPQF